MWIEEGGILGSCVCMSREESHAVHIGGEGGGGRTVGPTSNDVSKMLGWRARSSSHQKPLPQF